MSAITLRPFPTGPGNGCYPVELQKIITLAHAPHRMRFVLMERSLRAVGCDLPLRVIPYDDDLFELPRNAQYWKTPQIFEWLGADKSMNIKRKYQCLTTNDFQYIDTDAYFVRNPADVLKAHRGLVVCCHEWRWSSSAPNSCVTVRSAETMRRRNTLFYLNLFARDSSRAIEPCTRQKL